MENFKDIQGKLQQAKRDRDSIRKASLLSKERLNKLNRKKSLLIRNQNSDSDDLNAILSEERQLLKILQEQNRELDVQIAMEVEILEAFLPFTNPEEHVRQFSDEFPLLLFPVRIETRFKKDNSLGRDGQFELWVRIFPDECSIQTFEDIPSETEVKALKAYWQLIWEAGQSEDESLKSLIKNKKKAAWKNLAGNLMAGRAYWLTENYQPSNLNDLPNRVNKTDIILTIPVEEIPATSEAIKTYWKTYWEASGSELLINTAFEDLVNTIGDQGVAKSLISEFIPLNLSTAKMPTIKVWFIESEQVESVRTEAESEVILKIVLADDQVVPGEQEALKEYWKMIWLANGDVDLEATAFGQLSDKVGSDERADELILEFRPNNLADCPPPIVSVSFIQFPSEEDVPTKLSSWTAAAKATTLPDKFVLIGYKGSNPITKEPTEVLKKLGNRIPDPLIIGPDPGLDTSVILKMALITDYRSLMTEELKRLALVSYYKDFETDIKKETDQAIFIGEVLALPDDQLDARLEQIFDNIKDEVKAGKYIEYLSKHADTKWLFDFEEAVKMGMGFKVKMDEDDFNAGFDRLFVLGIKLSADELESKISLEELLKNHHYGTSGLSILPQGTPTNNTETTDAGFSENEDSDETFERYLEESETSDPDDFDTKKDGKWLSELLGIDADSATLKKVENYYHTDQCESKAMNKALWPGTLGYFMESMLTPIFNDNQKSVVKEYFNSFVSGRGNLPAIRIGDQPYGILAVSKLPKENWVFGNIKKNLLSKSRFGNSIAILQQLYTVLDKIRADFKELSDEVAFIGKEGDDAHQILLDVLGLHASSVEFHQRYAQSFAQLYNHLNLTTVCRDKLADDKEKEYKKDGLELLSKLGYQPDDNDLAVPILEKFFLGKQNLLKGDLIDDQPLSEIKPIRAYTEPEAVDVEGENYIAWLIENALDDFEKIKKQQGFADKAPTALLYQMLRHSLVLAFSDTALNLHKDAAILDSQEVQMAKVDPEFIPVRKEGIAVENRLTYLDRIEPRITSENISVSQHISKLLGNSNLLNISPILSALEHLKDVPTARLERVFVEHLDTCFYRLDAWLLGFVNLQLALMRTRNLVDGEEESSRPGIYLGAYGWVENLKPDESDQSIKNLEPDLKDIFDPNGENDILTDTENAGYIHAPSINQAITAAVLRNAYISDASQDDPEVYKVNLSSERVRMALSMIEGMQQGQGLSELLGYQLERGLHDRYDEAEVDEFIYVLREKFPLRNKLNETAVEENEIDSITQIEARNVVDGIKLIEHVQKNLLTNTNYSIAEDFFSVESTARKKIIDQEVDRILNIEDAIADVAISEGVHQVVQSNFDRAAGNLETYSKGSFPQMPEVVKTPRSGINLTNRFGMHFQAGLATIATDKPRVKAEPAINDFLETVLPALTELACQISYHKPNYEEGDNHPITTKIVLISELNLSPLDLFYLLDVDSAKSLTALDEYILKHVYENDPVRTDEIIAINYTVPIDDKITIFEIAPLLKSLRSLILGARPLKSTDMLLPNEANRDADLSCSIDFNRVDAAFNDFKNNFSTVIPSPKLDIVLDPFVSLFDEIPDSDHISVNESDIIENIDAYSVSFINHLHQLSNFGIQHAGFGFVYDRKAAIYSAVYKKVLDYKNRWEKKKEKFVLLSIEEGSLDVNDFISRLEILQKMERTISTEYTVPIPADLIEVNQYKIELNGKKISFDLKFDEITTFLSSSFSGLKPLFDEIDNFVSGPGSVTGIASTIYDLLSLEIEEEKRQAAILGEDMVRQAIKLESALVEIKEKTEEYINQYNLVENPLTKAARLTSAVQQLFGESFKIIPEFNFTESQKIEILKVYTNRESLLDYQKTDKLVDFPVDDWLYSVARVREKLEIWENTAILTEGFKGIDLDFNLDLEALQFPYQENDSWLGLAYPETYSIDSDKLLYTAFLDNFNPVIQQCGLLIDEWTEVIPTKMETTGLAIQYDQPNTEAPQTMLLVTPSTFTGSWDWDDLTGALHETLDLAKLRAVEPKQIDKETYAQFLPTTVTAVTSFPLLTVALNYAVNNGFELQANTNNDA